MVAEQVCRGPGKRRVKMTKHAHISAVSGFTTMRRNAQLETIAVDTNLHAFRYTQQDEKLAHGGDLHPAVAPSPMIMEGITDDVGIAGLRNGDTRTASAASDWKVISNAGLELFRTYGLCRSEFSEQFHAEFSEHPFFDLEYGKATVDNVVRYDSFSELLFDRQGMLMPKAMYGCYIDAHLDEQSYDLEKAAAHLLTREDVFVAAARGFTDPDMQTPALSPLDAIHGIPGYNASPGRQRCLHILWRPSKADYQKMWDQANTYGKHASLSNWRAIFDLDLLGLRAAGASKEDNS